MGFRCRRLCSAAPEAWWPATTPPTPDDPTSFRSSRLRWPPRWYSLRIAAAGVVQTKVQKWGNSLGVRIPRGLAEEVGLGAGTEVSLTAKDGELVLRPSVPSRLKLGDLLAGVTPENIHAFVDTGDAVGAEAF